MCHLNPELIESLLRKESSGGFCKYGEQPSPFRFYVPYLYMPVAQRPAGSGEQPADIRPDADFDITAALRSDFHSFVFIQAPSQRVDAIVHSDWNQKARLRLHYYRDHEGNSIQARDDEVQRLMDTFRDKSMGFFIGQPVEAFSEGDEVVINTGSWAGREGVVMDKRLSKGQLVMVVGMNVFNRTMSINFTNLKPGDVTFKNADSGALFTDNPVTQLEEETIDILSHRYNRQNTMATRQDDAARLRRLAAFDRVFIETSDQDYPRVLSLRLIGATLRQSARRRKFEEQVRQALKGKAISGTYDEAYLMTALFIATRKACHRDAAKDYRNAHPDCPDTLRRLLPIVKKVKAKPST